MFRAPTLATVSIVGFLVSGSLFFCSLWMGHDPRLLAFHLVLDPSCGFPFVREIHLHGVGHDGHGGSRIAEVRDQDVFPSPGALVSRTGSS